MSPSLKMELQSLKLGCFDYDNLQLENYTLKTELLLSQLLTEL